MLDLHFHNGLILDPKLGALSDLSVAQGRIAAPSEHQRPVDLDGFVMLPGLVDLHGDGFERHLAPRRGALPDLSQGLVSLDAELAAAGITTAVLAQFWSWEGGMRGPEFALKLARGLAVARPKLRTQMVLQLRLETHMIEDFPEVLAFLRNYDVRYVVLNDHLPHDRLASGRTPRRLTGQALKSGRSPEAHHDLMKRLHARSADVPAALEWLSETLRAEGVLLGTHDDRTVQDRVYARQLGAHVAEFPETVEAAQAAKDAGDPIILGAPNVVRGASHSGNVSARTLIADGLCDALVSDYHYPSLKNAAVALAGDVGATLGSVWALGSRGPARIYGFEDRGTLARGARADLTILDRDTGQVVATFCGGAISFLSGPFARRLFG